MKFYCLPFLANKRSFWKRVLTTYLINIITNITWIWIILRSEIISFLTCQKDGCFTCTCGKRWLSGRSRSSFKKQGTGERNQRRNASKTEPSLDEQKRPQKRPVHNQNDNLLGKLFLHQEKDNWNRWECWYAKAEFAWCRQQ